MSGDDLLLLVGIFLGGAAPWLEAVLVVPAGILAGVHPVVAVVVGVSGNLLTVAVAAWFGQRIRRWWLARREARRAERGEPAAAESPRQQRRRQRIERLLKRWGMPALALLGPIGLGTQLSALVAVGLGVRAVSAFWWIAAGTVLWSIVAALAAVAGVSVAGVGA